MKEIKTLLVGVLGVLLVTGAFAQPVYARTSQAELKAVSEATSQSQLSIYHKGAVSTLDMSQLSEQWNSVNGDPNKIVFVQNGQLASGWMLRNTWKYFDPTTHFLVRNQAKVINGKEYFFNYSGDMLYDINVGNSYYGVDGAKSGVANPNKSTYKTSRCFNLIDCMPYQEFEQKVQEGKIKVEVEYGKIVGSTGISSSLNFVYKG